jgi:hypothetical protein
MRPPLLPITDTTDRNPRYENAKPAPKVPIWHLWHHSSFSLMGRHASLWLAIATVVT